MSHAWHSLETAGFFGWIGAFWTGVGGIGALIFYKL
jgi:hypothetical protein